MIFYINWDANECLENGIVEEIRLIDVFNDKNINNYTDENYYILLNIIILNIYLILITVSPFLIRL